MKRSVTRYLLPFIIIVLSVVLLCFHRDLRVWWWAYQLRYASYDNAQLYFFQRLCAAGETSLPVARSLISDDDSALRGFGTAMLHHVDSPAAHELLLSLIDDQDESVSTLALQGLSARHDVSILPVLRQRSLADSPAQAIDAVAMLADYDCAQSADMLIGILNEQALPLVRAQTCDVIAYMNCQAAVSALIESLHDCSTFVGMTEFDRWDAAARAWWQENQNEPLKEEAPSGGESRVCEYTARALRQLTGQSFGFDATASDEQREQAIAKWQNWLANPSQPDEEE